MIKELNRDKKDRINKYIKYKLKNNKLIKEIIIK